VRPRHLQFRHRARHRAISDILSAVLLVTITIILMVVVFFIRLPLYPTPPHVGYVALVDAKYQVFGDPTDCRPNLPYAWSYYLGNGTGDPRWNTYMNDWNSQCEESNTGVYNLMNATRILITQVSGPIPLADLEFRFVCTNYTPTFDQTYLVDGSLAGMEFIPGVSPETFGPHSPLLGYCATLRAEGSGASSTYYNRLGFFDPESLGATTLIPGQAIVIYIHTPGSVFEAPNPIEPQSEWNLPDADDYHGAPPWCFTVPGACEVQLFDTAWSPAVLLVSIPMFAL
jgi:hypothetical protein